MTTAVLAATVLPAAGWRAREAAHEARADALTAAHRERRARHEKHPIEDFLYEYYGLRPARLRRWQPGVGVALEGAPERAAWRWHRELGDDGGAVGLDARAFLADRGEGVRWLHELLRRTAGRPAHLGCLGLHEWAMVYRQEEHRHPLPLRLGQRGTDAVVEAHPVRCTHFDAFRFFTPAARPLNRLQPERATQLGMEQPGCLHANMDLLKTALKLGPAVPGGLLLDCFELARDIRVLDMRASPYDVTALGHTPVAIETAPGRAEYVAQQRRFAERAEPLRARLLAVTTALLGAA
ncbi:3-methyladenine DNA glycosylase [Georgenia sp. AZ-5]|uniref:3-methyladenine DNA glycosylase n=1 Tax=Georgenia sp. AZ-5 TaxID=3367526 RepID=UPI0037541E22